MFTKSEKTLLALTAVATIATGIVWSSIASAGTLENLERERAMTVATFLDTSLAPNQRHGKISVAKRRLIDMERMVLRDESLRGKKDNTVRRAFSNYDLTFMAHASSEKNLTMLDSWLEQFAVTTDSLMVAKVGRR